MSLSILKWASLMPGYLAFFDLADLKRRNVFLGHLRGDQEITEFDALLRQCIGNSELVERYGGDEWFTFLPTHPEKVLTQIIDMFRKRMPIRFGWQCDAIDHVGETLRTIHTKPMTVTARRTLCLRRLERRGAIGGCGAETG